MLEALDEQVDHVVSDQPDGRVRREQALLLVALDHIGGTNAGIVGIAAGLTERAPLAEQVPALVERDFHSEQPLMLL